MDLFKRTLKFIEKLSDEFNILFDEKSIDFIVLNKISSTYFKISHIKELFDSYEIEKRQITIDSKKIFKQFEKITNELQLVFDENQNILQLLIKQPDTIIKIPVFFREETILPIKIPSDCYSINFKAEMLKHLKIAFQRLSGIGSSYFKLAVSESELTLSAKGHIDREETIITIDLNDSIPGSYSGKFQAGIFFDFLFILDVSEVNLKFKPDSPLYIEFEKSVYKKQNQITGCLILSQFINESFKEENSETEESIEFDEDFKEEDNDIEKFIELDED